MVYEGRYFEAVLPFPSQLELQFSDGFFALPVSMLGDGFNESRSKLVCCGLTGDHTFVCDDWCATGVRIG